MKLDIEEHTAEYYIVAVEEEEYKWIFQRNDGAINKEPWKTIDAWCRETFGEPGTWGGPPTEWKRMGPRYFFQNNGDRALFVLRWA